MNAKRRAVTAFAAIALGVTSISAAAQGMCQGDQHPFNGTFNIKESIRFLQAPQGLCAAFGTIQGEGMTTLGGATITTSDCITPVPGTPTNIFNSTEVTFTIDGRRLRATYIGQATATSPFPPAGLNIVGALAFTGGTGRFAQPQGTAVITGSETLVPGNGMGELTYQGTFNISGCIGGVR